MDDLLLNPSTCITIISSIWAITAVACIAFIVLGIVSAPIRILQLLVTTYAMTGALAYGSGLFGEPDGQNAILYLALGGFVATILGVRMWFAGSASLAGCLVLILVFSIGCPLIWLLNLYFVVIGCLTALFNAYGRKKIASLVLLALLAQPILGVAVSPKIDIISSLMFRPMCKSVINWTFSHTITQNNTFIRQLRRSVYVPTLRLSGAGTSRSFEEFGEITAKNLAEIAGTTLPGYSEDDDPLAIVYPKVQQNDNGEAVSASWHIRNMNFNEQVYYISYGGYTPTRLDTDAVKMSTGQVIYLHDTREDGKIVARVSVSVH